MSAINKLKRKVFKTPKEIEENINAKMGAQDIKKMIADKKKEVRLAKYELQKTKYELKNAKLQLKAKKARSR